ncbi:MAG: glycerol-3-phosphate dehydrogenase/oxidase [Pirellulales bacterium]|nr:glycerol-3-phosphate dehydrogenase/oxidase [Pirellulales bacterium]
MRRVNLDQSRADQAARWADDRLDVLVVGGGIVGAGIARDAAMRGLRTGLVDQHDLAFGTSSRSSRLLHGGLRYLAQGRIGLVREASREKMTLHRIACHLSQPLPFAFPTYRRTRWPLWQLRIGVKLYDWLCGARNLGPSQALTPEEVAERFPGINPHGLTGAVRYFDGLTNDSRLVLDTLRSAARQGAIVSNYTRVEDALPCPSGWTCHLRDVRTDRPGQLVARSVVNATGPWAQSLPQSTIRLRLTKGVHLVIDSRRLPVPDAVVITQKDRILFAIPWGQRVILGTTDTDYDGPIEDVATEPDDVGYILQVANTAFPSAALRETDVISTWAGLRPLIDSGRGGPSDISRAHEIRLSDSGWLDVAGGKLTTYRLIAEQAVDRLVQYLGHHGPPCRTAQQPLLEPEEVQGVSGVLPPEVTAEAVEHYCAGEWAVHLDDVMIRRTGWYYYLPDVESVARQVAGWMAEIFGWDQSRQEAELARIACKRPEGS